MPTRHHFTAALFRWGGPRSSPGSWTFVRVPPEHAPDHAGAFGRVPVQAEVDGRAWATSVWRGEDGEVLLAVPKKIRRGKEDGDEVEVSFTLDLSR